MAQNMARDGFRECG